ncbi:MAG: radical SAM protein [Bacteroidales bacterium]|nr:radical SAM protein [Bacteroidales bacterium]
MDYIVKSIVAKVSNMCNLNCSYCYVFNRGNKNYRSIPNKLSEELIEKMLYRIKDHCIKHNLMSFTIILHGGEPLILGIKYFEFFLKKSKYILDRANIKVMYILQTNGTLMTEEWAKFLVKNNINVGFSFDGYESIHNENRIYKNSEKGSYRDVVKGMNVFKKYYPLHVLSVINTNSDPIRFYKTIKDLELNSVSLLMQDITYDNFYNVNTMETSEWMIKLFDIWFDDENKNKLTLLEPFSLIINIILGGANIGNDSYGLVENNCLLVLST